MPEIRWQIPKEFRRAISETLMAWDFRSAPNLIVRLPAVNPIAAAGVFVAEGGTIEPIDLSLKVNPTVRLKAEVMVERIGHDRPTRVFVVTPAMEEDVKAIFNWEQAAVERRKWLREDET